MPKDSYYYSRGQVWKCVGFGKKNVGHEQKKDRPVLIISTPEFYAETKLLLVAPFTTKYKHSHYVLDVSTPSDYVNYLLLEHICTIDPNSPDYKMTFLYSLSSSAMERVDSSLKYLLGFQPEVPSFPKAPPRKSKKNIATNVSAKTPKPVEERDSSPAETTPKAVAPSMLSWNGNLQSSPKREFTIPSEDIDATETEKVTPCEPVPFPKLPNQRPPKSETPKRKRRLWTIDKAQEFLDDCTSKPREEVISKWDIQNIKAYYSMKNYCEDIVTKP